MRPIVEKVQDAVEMGVLEAGTAERREFPAQLGQILRRIVRDRRSEPIQDVGDVVGGRRLADRAGGCH
jgi:hypothetical protein